ncbi:MAG: diguanylate cyclase [Polyangiaceae bacterium]|nr:diguanylate cyclase [Polyangiaceae bacterium]
MDRDAPSSLKTIVSTSEPRARDRGVLTVTGGEEAGRLISLSEAQFTFGRSDEATVRLADVSLSRIHARLIRAGGHWIIADAGSTNGTFVNDARLTKPVALADGDRVQLGSSTVLRFSLVDQAEEQSLRQVYEAAMKDGLTGVSNRKHLEERLDAEVAYALRHETELSLVMLDVDHFKRVNDTFGHPAGDAVLRFMAATLQQTLRTEDLLARYGGEEFCILVRGVDARTTTTVADRLRLWISQSPVDWQGQQIWITSSAGVASLACCGEARDKATLVSTADQRLYKAKHGGRNRVVGPDGP